MVSRVGESGRGIADHVFGVLGLEGYGSGAITLNVLFYELHNGGCEGGRLGCVVNVTQIIR